MLDRTYGALIDTNAHLQHARAAAFARTASAGTGSSAASTRSAKRKTSVMTTRERADGVALEHAFCMYMDRLLDDVIARRVRLRLRQAKLPEHSGSQS